VTQGLVNTALILSLLAGVKTGGSAEIDTLPAAGFLPRTIAKRQ
jgi:hypothetical protein